MTAPHGVAGAVGSSRDVEVAVVGGGPAGAAVAARLAAAGWRTVVFERQPRQRWRASGVYSSALTRRRLAALGLSAGELARLVEPIATTVIRTTGGDAQCVIEHEPDPACGVDRVRLENALIALARSAGVDVREGSSVVGVELGGRAGSRLLVSEGGATSAWRARVVVGADGPSSLVARTAGVARPVRRFRRAGVIGHRLRTPTGAPAPAGSTGTAEMVIGSGWYLGVAPVPGGRVNLGLVVGERELRRDLAAGLSLDEVMDVALGEISPPATAWRDAPPTDRLATRLPLAHAVARVAGHGFVLVGDAAGFIDPLSGEGLHRALYSAEMAERAIGRWLKGDLAALGDYDRRLRARFRSKDVVSWLLQLFLFRPALAAYALRRLDRRPLLRRRFALGMADAAPGSTLVDPRFLGRLLAP
jgi:menaquinone-9 beta-reductase